MSDIVIGIDLGTTNSCICVHQNNNIKLLENLEGARITPSFVYFTNNDDVLVGQLAKKMGALKPERGVSEIKRLIGREYNDPHVQKNLTYLPFEVKASASNEPVIVIPNENEGIEYTPQDIYTIILEHLKAAAEAKLRLPVDQTVITVPAYFNVTQREATLAASQKAGFRVLKLLNEPTAAALNYYYDKKSLSVEESLALVYDLGGGTFDVAILSCKDTNIKIIGVGGETHLGGHDFDNLLVEHVCQILISQHDYDPKNNRRDLRRLKSGCQEAKEALSSVDEFVINLRDLGPDQLTVDIPITRAQFEEVAHHLFQQTIDVVDRCLRNCDLAGEDIQEIILSGGSTRIPKVQAMIRDYFGGKELCRSGNLDECVAEGAAIQAAMLSEDDSQAIQHNMNITDVTPLSLGISDFVGGMNVIIERNTTVPTSAKMICKTLCNNQEKMTFLVYEGERAEADKNYFLGYLEISDLTPAPPGECEVSLTMSIDQNSILKIAAKETVSNQTKDAAFTYSRGSRRSDKVVDSRENELEDRRFREFAENKKYVIDYCVETTFNLENHGLVPKYKDVYDACAEALSKLEILDVEDEKELAELETKIVDLCTPVLNECHDILEDI